MPPSTPKQLNRSDGEEHSTDEAIKFRMEQQGLMPRDPEPLIGWLSCVCEVLSRRRPLTMAMVWRLHTQLAVPVASRLRPPRSA